MRLLYRHKDTNVLTFKDYPQPGDIPTYAILSHTWGKPQDEVTYLDIKEHRVNFTSKPGYQKLEFCLDQAAKDGLEYVWVDTCCIDKRDFYELSREIHSMYRWYKNSKKCYVYLSDISTGKRDHRGELRPIANSEIAGSRWFTRGWTLQELLAPSSVEFYSQTRVYLGSRQDLASVISARTGIAEDVLLGTVAIARHTRKARLSWGKNRSTTNPEDKAYCLIGLLEVSMPLIPGETEDQAMRRLRKAMLEESQDDNDPEAGSQERGPVTSQPDAQSGIDNSANASQSDRRKALLESLSFQTMHSRRHQAKKPYPSTCAWLSDHPVYKQWLDGKEYKRHHGLLWIKGNPGAGKTTLVKYADDVACPKNVVRVGFYFHARSTEVLQKSIDGMYRSLLHQLLDRQTALQNLVLETFNASIDTDSAIEWSRETLQEMLAFVFANSGKRQIHCYIDALDECDIKQVQQMIDLFETINQDSAAEKRYLRILLASRHYPIIRIPTDLELDLDKVPEHINDIERYVDGKLDTGMGPMVNDINKQIVVKARGIFMWTVLVVDILNEEFKEGAIFNVQRRLDELPPGLSDLFEELIKRDAGKNLDRFRCCLQWLLYSKRPLSCKEFYCAMALHESKDNMDRSTAHQPTEEHMKKLVSSSSKGLAEVSTGGTATVQFIHESVRDYLLKDDGLQHIFHKAADQSFFEAAGHEALATSCRHYLKTDLSDHLSEAVDDPDLSVRHAKRIQRNLTAVYPLIDYAVNSILHHANCATNAPFQENFAQLFDPIKDKWRQLSNLFERYRTHRLSRSDTHLICFYAARDADKLIGLMAASYSQPLDAQALSRALYIALAKAHKASVKAVLEYYSISLPDDMIRRLPTTTTYSARHDLRPFVWAIAKRQLSFVYALLQSELFVSHLQLEDINTCGYGKAYHFGDCGTLRDLALSMTVSAAVEWDDIELLQRCLDDGVSMLTRNHHGYTMIMQAAKYQRYRAIELLVDRGADLSGATGYGQTALHLWCSFSGRDGGTLPNELLANNPSINQPDTNGTTALMRAAEYHVKDVSLLLAHGAVVNATDELGRTALMYAARNSRADILRVLLEHNADVNATDEYGRTALMHAARDARAENLMVLLQYNADINAADKYGETTLMHVAFSYPDATPVLQVLLQHYADVNATAKDGHTALLKCLATAQLFRIGHVSTLLEHATILIEHGAQTNVADSMGITPLMILVKPFERHIEISQPRPSHFVLIPWQKLIDQLVANGADARIVDENGESALSRAQSSRYSQVRDMFASVLVQQSR